VKSKKLVDLGDNGYCLAGFDCDFSWKVISRPTTQKFFYRACGMMGTCNQKTFDVKLAKARKLAEKFY
jgi:hypothetical protein